MPPLLKVNNLRIDFLRDNNWQETVHGIDFEVYKGKTLGIVGESGSGKSVSNLAILQLLDKRKSSIKVDSILLNGNDISDLNDDEMTEIRGKKIAMIFQEPMTSLNPVYKCGFQVMEAIRRQHPTINSQQRESNIKGIISKKENQKSKEKVLELFRKVLLPNPEVIFNKYPHELSGGQKQRVMIAMALVSNPELLIADEPTTALDVTVQKEILKLLKELQHENGMGMIFITHDLGVISEIADDVIVMNKGEIVERGPVYDILNNPQHPYTWALLESMPSLSTSNRLSAIPGTPPNMIYPPKGDAFAQRNRYALKIDFEQEPPFFKVTDTHYAATWLLHENAPKVENPLKNRYQSQRKETNVEVTE